MAPEVRIVIATEELARHIGANLRPADLAEVRAAGYANGEDALLHSLALSAHAFVALIDGEPACMFGSADHPHATAVGGPTRGRVWMLGTPVLGRHPKELIRWSPRMLRFLLLQYEVVDVWIDARYEGALRWARWLGFTVGEPRPYADGSFCHAHKESTT